MADILIRGMEMPKGCKSCKLSSDSHCNATGQWLFSTDLLRSGFNWKTCRLPDCPLVELPEHGDLIERDALKHKFCAHCDGYEYDTGACVDGDQDCMDAKIIMNAPIIVPSNKEDAE